MEQHSNGLGEFVDGCPLTKVETSLPSDADDNLVEAIRPIEAIEQESVPSTTVVQQQQQREVEVQQQQQQEPDPEEQQQIQQPELEEQQQQQQPKPEEQQQPQQQPKLEEQQPQQSQEQQREQKPRKKRRRPSQEELRRQRNLEWRLQQQLIMGFVIDGAITFLDLVRNEFSDEPHMYNTFLNIMNDFKMRVINTTTVIALVSNLFHDHPLLMQGFSVFLPREYSLDLRDNQDINTNYLGVYRRRCN